MTRTRFALCAALLAAATLRPSAADEAPQRSAATPPTYARDVAPFLTAHCTICHGGAKPKGGLSLENLADEAAARKLGKTWERVLVAVRSGDMPPATRRRPNPTEVIAVTRWIETTFFDLDCTKRTDPGRVTLRRLNRTEYNNTVRDLLGVDFQPAADFPADDVGYGFDHIGDVLSLPPLLLEKYLAAAEKIATAALASGESRQRLLLDAARGTELTEAATRRSLEHFLRRAYRRPARPAEVDRLLGLVRSARKHGETAEGALGLALQAVLVSPHFLFRVEPDPEPNTPNQTRRLNDFEVATRLSYFLWSSTPDEELLRLAEAGKLREGGTLEAQVQRLLRDPRGRALTENFAGQWLQLRNLKTVSPDPKLFPTFNDALRSAMARETEQFFEAVVNEDRSVLDFLDADFTFVNEALAKHYGIPNVKGAHFRRVSLADTPRRGVLTHASVLTVTSNPTRTSPVKRGKWILENVLNAPPPPPPPNVPELNESRRVADTASLRKRLEQHRADPSCAVCHDKMDTLGFGFENFDAVGAWRDRDGRFSIDPGGTLPGGQSFKSPKELAAVLRTQQDAFARCVAEKLLTYALGRGLEYYDKCAVDKIVAALAKGDHKFSVLVREVVQSEPFQYRRGRGAKR